ncbi:hypothetical protein EYF80_017887 [Liparis tanakae]|uniref:Uncharacterized protein n=1 Tax=Liparis tanakae TaxID=230148 RepID=A0A4Z2I216_9TELE|nr:hypothetical protein EYF80_017887 [Liparis tanakae]
MERERRGSFHPKPYGHTAWQRAPPVPPRGSDSAAPQAAPLRGGGDRYVGELPRTNPALFPARPGSAHKCLVCLLVDIAATSSRRRGPECTLNATADWSARRNTVFSPGSDWFSARSQLGGSLEQRLILLTNKEEEEKIQLCAKQRLTPSEKPETNRDGPYWGIGNGVKRTKGKGREHRGPSAGALTLIRLTTVKVVKIRSSSLFLLRPHS